MTLDEIEKIINDPKTKYRWLVSKNNLLVSKAALERRKSFNQIVLAIKGRGYKRVLMQKDLEKYPDTFLILVFIDDYPYIVPAHLDKDGNRIVLRTNYPDRKYKKKVS